MSNCIQQGPRSLDTPNPKSSEVVSQVELQDSAGLHIIGLRGLDAPAQGPGMGFRAYAAAVGIMRVGGLGAVKFEP